MPLLRARAIATLPRRGLDLEDGVYPKGRRCAIGGCTTILSIYNPGPRCWLCKDRHPSPPTPMLAR